jgi:hypothetical protein
MVIIKELKVRNGKAIIPNGTKEILDVWGFNKELVEWDEDGVFIVLNGAKAPYTARKLNLPSKIKVRYLI